MIDFFFEENLGFKNKRIKKIIEETTNLVISELHSGKKKEFYISILLTDDRRIKKMNLKYRKINKSTNVLSFPQNVERQFKPAKSLLILGDIVISLEKIRMESIAQGKGFSNHLAHMVVHSILHLFGYKHKNEREAKIMEKKEINILSKLCISPLY